MKKTIIALSVFALAFTACKKDPHDHNEQEQITTLWLQLQNQDVLADMPTATFEDLDGAGGNAPTADTLVLLDSSEYYAQIVLLDKTKTPIDTISIDVLEEGDEHQFFFTPSAGVTVQYNDQDVNGKPIGLQSIINTAGVGAGTLRIVLRHQPDGIKTGSNATGGETDIDVTFPLIIN